MAPARGRTQRSTQEIDSPEINPHLCLNCLFCERERESARAWAGEGQRERGTEDPKQARGGQPRARWGLERINREMVTSAIERRTLNRRRHPAAPGNKSALVKPADFPGAAKTSRRGKNTLFNNRPPVRERMKVDPYLTPHAKLTSKWILGRNARAQSRKRLEDDT